MWIRDYRERNKLELWQFQQRVNDYGKQMEIPLYGTVSAQLIHMLEVDKNAVTHPRIADVIAILCGATPKQRDMIVDAKYKGTFDPDSADRELLEKVNSKQFVKGVDYHQTPEIKANEARLPYTDKFAVVKLDMLGNTIERYESIKSAASHENIGTKTIRSRCMRRVKNELGVFKCKNGKTIVRKYTYRYADEWDKMSSIEKMNDVKCGRVGDS